MFKKSSLAKFLLLVCSIGLSLIFSGAVSVSAAPIVTVDERFESTITSVPVVDDTNCWNLTANSVGTLARSAVTNEFIMDKSSATSGQLVAVRCFPRVTGSTQTIEARIKLDKNDATGLETIIQLRSSATFAKIILKTDGKIYFNPVAGADQYICDYNAGQWYHFKIIYDSVKNKISCIMRDDSDNIVGRLEDVACTNPVTYINRLSLLYTAGTNTQKFYMDDFKVTDDTALKTSLNETFDGAVASGTNGWTFSFGSSNPGYTGAVAKDAGNSLLISKKNTGTYIAGNVLAYNDFTSISSTVAAIETRIKFSENVDEVRLQMRSAAVATYAYAAFKAGGNVSFYIGATEYPLGVTYNIGQWYRVKILFDMINNKLSFILKDDNENLIGRVDNLTTAIATKALDRVSVVIIDTANLSQDVYVDNFKVSSGIAPNSISQIRFKDSTGGHAAYLKSLGTVKGVVNITGLSPSVATNGTLILALYEGNDLVDVKYVSTPSAVKCDESLTLETDVINLPATVANCKAKAFLWDGLSQMKPLALPESLNKQP